MAAAGQKARDGITVLRKDDKRRVGNIVVTSLIGFHNVEEIEKFLREYG